MAACNVKLWSKKQLDFELVFVLHTAVFFLNTVTNNLFICTHNSN